MPDQPPTPAPGSPAPGFPTPTPPPAANGAASSGKRRMAMGVALLAVLAGAAYGGYLYWHGLHYQSTDDAFIDGTVVQVSPQISGPVVRVAVRDNQHVAAGDLLLKIDPRDYQARQEQARAAKQAAEARLKSADADLATIHKTAAAALAEQDGAAAGAAAGVESAKARIAAAESARVQALARVEAARAAAEQAQAQASSAEASANWAAGDLTRYDNLFKSGGITRSQLDQYATAAKTTAAAQEAAKQHVAAAQAQVGEALAGVKTAEETVGLAQAQAREAEGKLREIKGKRAGADVVEEKVAKAEADRARAAADVAQAAAALVQADLDLEHTTIVAAQSGTVTRKSVEVGSYVRPGQALLAVVGDEKWVVANFKETQLTNMRPGQAATVTLDSCPGLHLNGKVDSVQQGTGSRFSLLPAENATGNYVKVVQRVPVKIVFDGPLPADVDLSLGLSAVPEVKIK